MNKMLGFLKKEIIALMRDPVLLFAILFMPVLQITLLSLAVTMEARNLKLAVDIEPGDVVMERIYEHALGSGWFIKIPKSPLSALESVQSGMADAAIVAPEGGVTKSLVRGEGRLQLLIDATNVLKAQTIEGYLSGIISSALKNEMFLTVVSPIIFSTRLMFNPELDTRWFLLPGLLVMVVFTSILSLVTVSITREKESGTIETLISAPITKYHIIFGKTLPYIMLALIIMFLILGIGYFVLGIPFVGSMSKFILAFLVFSFPASAIAILLSTYAHTQQQAMLGMMIIIFLCSMLSGMMFPVENMPEILQVLAKINPLTHYMYLVRNIILKDGGWLYFFNHSFYLLVVGCVVSYFAVRRFKITL